MSQFNFENDHLYVESLALSEIASQHGTPCYVYSKKAFIDQLKQYQYQQGLQKRA